ncbi:hypothetical protein ACLIJS_07590 [Mammaliicoccus sciuri]|uniref:hypothetical protein n=1 Tax=Mammaliicoccus sciuri TaxID=1296 RepID=UPI000D1E937E|nr:hypothetical protein [Mammaliicoccus sciuri]MEB7782265.1 hypothetical protein [Mammaliicoccus sciuri]PTK01393.1 hypothetical protein BUZ87_08400 [Mammaliicoccus sciuri]PTK10091.1 hypothetical protein BU001_05375 [Mammaliicoccus sciuri]
MRAYRVVTKTPVVFERTFEIVAEDEEDIRNQLDTRMKSCPYDFSDTNNFEVGEYDLENIEVRGIENG